MNWLLVCLTGLVAAVLGCSLSAPTYGDHCTIDADCEDPFSCLNPTFSDRRRCTLPCEDDQICGEATGNGCILCVDGLCGGSDCE